MTDEERERFFRTLTPEEYAAAPVPSKEEIRAALRKGAEDLRRAMAAPRPCPPCSGRRYR